MINEKEYDSIQKGNKAYDPVWVARELGYSEDVIQRISKAKSDSEVTRIMATARQRGNKK